MVYFIISGAIQIIISILVILLLFEILGKENKLLWFRIITAIVVLELASNFCIAIYASLMTPYFGVLFELALNISQATIDLLPSSSQNLIYCQKNLYSYCMAEAIFTWIACVPCICVILVGLLTEFVSEESISGSTKISPTKLPTETTQVESFGPNKS